MLLGIPAPHSRERSASVEGGPLRERSRFWWAGAIVGAIVGALFGYVVGMEEGGNAGAIVGIVAGIPAGGSCQVIGTV